MSTEHTWVVAEGTMAYGSKRHLLRDRGWGVGTCEHFLGKQYRELEDHELVYFAPCGHCVPAEEDGPADAAEEAAAAIRESAAALATTAMKLGDLGYHRMGRRLQVLSERVFVHAERTEVES